MKRSHLLLVIGAGLLITSIVIGAYTSVLIQNSSLSQIPDNQTRVPLQPNANHTQIVPARNGETFAIVTSHQPPEVPVTGVVQDPGGRIVIQFDVAQTTSQFSAITEGNHFVIIKNEGSQPVEASLSVISLGVFGDDSAEFSPFLNDAFTFLGFAVLAGVLGLAGIILLIIGGIKFFRERGKGPKA